MGEIDLDPNHGESDGARWFMTETESVPYSSEQDVTVPVGTVIPGVIIGGEFSVIAPTSDARPAGPPGTGRWRWRAASTPTANTRFRFRPGLHAGRGLDHSQIRHTRHVRPIRLEVE